jgi:hypothetical protein
MPNHEDVCCSEHQISLSKGLIAKFVQRLELAAALFFAPNRKATAAVSFPVRGDGTELVAFGRAL